MPPCARAEGWDYLTDGFFNPRKELLRPALAACTFSTGSREGCPAPSGNPFVIPGRAQRAELRFSAPPDQPRNTPRNQAGTRARTPGWWARTFPVQIPPGHTKISHPLKFIALSRSRARRCRSHPASQQLCFQTRQPTSHCASAAPRQGLYSLNERDEL